MPLGAYPSQKPPTDLPEEPNFNSYLARGWIRPDLLPPARRFSAAKDWWDFFRELTKTVHSDYKISGALYREWYFLERYQGICVTRCKDDEGKP